MSSSPVIDTIRLNQTEIEALLTSLDRPSLTGTPESTQRKTHRWGMEGRRLILTTFDDHGGQRHFVALARNLSSGGVGLLFGGFLHVGARCSVTVRGVDGKPCSIPGAIARCQHLQGHLHELGIRFGAEIDPRRIIAFGDEHVFTIERVDLQALRGTLLIIEDNPSYQRLLGAYFKDSGLELVFAPDGEQGLALIEQHPDIVFVDHKLPGLSGIEVVQRARAAGFDGPMVLLTADSEPGLRKTALAAGATEMLQKPCPPASLHQAAAECLLGACRGQQPQARLVSTADPAKVTPAMIEEYIRTVQTEAKGLEDAVAQGNADNAREICRKLRAAAGGYGFEPLAALAQAGIQALDANPSVERSAQALRRLIQGCRRLTVSAAAADGAATKAA